MKVSQHWLESAERSASSHCKERPAGAEPEMLVIHCISLPPGEFGGRLVEDLFLGRLDTSAHPSLADLAEVRVSAHLLIDRRGQVRQFVPFDRAAWHAGASQFAGRTDLNDCSIGIELEGLPGTSFTDKQYRALAEVTGALFAAYPRLQHRRILGHCDVAPGRKADPGRLFDWQRYFKLLAQQKAAPA